MFSGGYRMVTLVRNWLTSEIGELIIVQSFYAKKMLNRNKTATQAVLLI